LSVQLFKGIKVVKIKPSLATTVQDIYYVLIVIATCFGLFNGHPQVIHTILGKNFPPPPMYYAHSARI
jgi:hypothetical protein